jgi:hypothetical protein
MNHVAYDMYEPDMSNQKPPLPKGKDVSSKQQESSSPEIEGRVL